MPEFLYQWPLWIVFVAMIGFFVGASQLMLLLIRRKLVPSFGAELHEGHFCSTLISSMMVLYGLVAALIAVNVYENYSDVHKVTSRESASLCALSRLRGLSRTNAQRPAGCDPRLHGADHS